MFCRNFTTFLSVRFVDLKFNFFLTVKNYRIFLKKSFLIKHFRAKQLWKKTDSEHQTFYFQIIFFIFFFFSFFYKNMRRRFNDYKKNSYLHEAQNFLLL